MPHRSTQDGAESERDVVVEPVRTGRRPGTARRRGRTQASETTARLGGNVTREGRLVGRGRRPGRLEPSEDTS